MKSTPRPKPRSAARSNRISRSTSQTDLLGKSDREFIGRQRVARLATADDTGKPHVVPIVYSLTGNRLYFVIDEKPKPTRRSLKRLRNIAENSQVAIVIDQYDDDWRRLRFVQLEGTAALVEDETEFERALADLRRRYPQYHDMPLSFAINPMVRVEITRTHGWRAVNRALI